MKTLEQYRGEIDAMNDSIVLAMAGRARYPVCRDFYEMLPQGHLDDLCYDTVLIHQVHLPVVRMICDPDDKDKKVTFCDGDFIHYDSHLSRYLVGRILIGREVMAAKIREGRDLTDDSRESEVIDHVRSYGAERGLDPEKITQAFEFIIEWNKQVQSACMECMRAFHDEAMNPVTVEEILRELQEGKGKEQTCPNL